jgi:hypothetical protein
MFLNRIVVLLSNHRQTHRTELPQSLTFSAIANLIHHSLPPQQEDISALLKEQLDELQAEGEILAGKGNLFCMAPPIVLREDENSLNGLLFRGDRVYLRLARQLLETEHLSTQLTLHPKEKSSTWIKAQLQGSGIRLLTAQNTIEHLPEPELPRASMLQGSEWRNLFESLNFIDLFQYIPSLSVRQIDRWFPVTKEYLSDRSLLKLKTGEFLWFEKETFYEIDPDDAILAMFYLDKSQNLPLSISWDEKDGRLNLQKTCLPTHYYQLLWRLSKADSDNPRIRRFEPAKRPTARESLRRLGCNLV